MSVEIRKDGQKLVCTQAPCCGHEVGVDWSWLFTLDHGMAVVCRCGHEWTLHCSMRSHGLPSVKWILEKRALRLVET